MNITDAAPILHGDMVEGSATVELWARLRDLIAGRPGKPLTFRAAGMRFVNFIAIEARPIDADGQEYHLILAPVSGQPKGEVLRGMQHLPSP